MRLDKEFKLRREFSIPLKTGRLHADGSCANRVSLNAFQNDRAKNRPAAATPLGATTYGSDGAARGYAQKGLHGCSPVSLEWWT